MLQNIIYFVYLITETGCFVAQQMKGFRNFQGLTILTFMYRYFLVQWLCSTVTVLHLASF